MGSRCRVQASRFRAHGLVSRVSGLGFLDLGSGRQVFVDEALVFRVQDSGLSVQGFGFRIYGCGIGESSDCLGMSSVQGPGFEVSGFEVIEGLGFGVSVTGF